MAFVETIQTAKEIESSINFSFFAFFFEILLIILIAKITERRHSFESVMTNGVVVFMAAGTLLFDQRPLGFILLAYAAFLLAVGVREYEEKKYSEAEWFGPVVKFFGHYLTVSAILVLVLAWEYVVPLFIG